MYLKLLQESFRSSVNANREPKSVASDDKISFKYSLMFKILRFYYFAILRFELTIGDLV